MVEICGILEYPTQSNSNTLLSKQIKRILALLATWLFHQKHLMKSHKIVIEKGNFLGPNKNFTASYFYIMVVENFGTSVPRSIGCRSGVVVRAVDCWQTT